MLYSKMERQFSLQQGRLARFSGGSQGFKEIALNVLEALERTALNMDLLYFKSLLLEVPLLGQYAKSDVYKSKSYNMLYILKQSLVRAADSMKDTDAKNLDTSLTVKHKILSKRG